MSKLGILDALQADEAKMQAAGAPLLGVVASYNVNPSGVERGALRAAIADAGFASIAKASVPFLSPEQALRAAVTAVAPPGRLAVLEIPVPADGADLEVGIYRGNPRAKSAPSASERPIMGARVRVKGGRIEYLTPEGVQWPLREPEEGEQQTEQEEACVTCMQFARKLAGRAVRLVRYAETSDITTALASVLESFHGAKLASHGRGHFLLARYVNQWAALLDVLAPFGVEPRTLALYGLPSHREVAKETVRESFADQILDLRKRLATAASKMGTTARGPRSDSMGKAVAECVGLINQAKIFQEVLGDLSSAVAADVEVLKKHFQRLEGGSSVVYGEADVASPIMGERQASSAERADPEAPLASVVAHTTDPDDGSPVTVVPSVS